MAQPKQDHGKGIDLERLPEVSSSMAVNLLPSQQLDAHFYNRQEETKMAEKDISFPKIAESNWWKLRNVFRQKIPATVTPSYLATALSMTEDSARANIIGPFKKLGILDETGKPSDLAVDWRDDSKYPSVCKTLFEKIYPQEVRDLFHTDDIDIKSLTGWFMNYCRSGEPAAKMYATFYKLLLNRPLKNT